MVELGGDESEVRMIEDIECFGTKLEMEPVMQRKLSPHSKVHLGLSEPPREVSRSVALICAGRIGKRSRIQRTSAWKLTAIKINRLARHKVHVGVVFTSCRRVGDEVAFQGNRESCSCNETTVKCPPVQ